MAPLARQGLGGAGVVWSCLQTTCLMNNILETFYFLDSLQKKIVWREQHEQHFLGEMGFVGLALPLSVSPTHPRP